MDTLIAKSCWSLQINFHGEKEKKRKLDIKRGDCVRIILQPNPQNTRCKMISLNVNHWSKPVQQKANF